MADSGGGEEQCQSTESLCIHATTERACHWVMTVHGAGCWRCGRTSDSTAMRRFSSSRLMRHHSRKYTVLIRRGVEGTIMAVCCAVVNANSCCHEDMSDAK